MTSVRNAIVAGACALGVTLGSLPAQAAWVGSPAAVETAQSASVMKVDWRDRRYGRYHDHHRGGNFGGYAAAGVLGLATGALIAGSASRSRGYDEEYYAPPARRVYVEEDRPVYRRCEVVRYREDRYGDPVRVITYRPC